MNKKPRILHRGDIFLNKYAGWRTLFVYINTSGRYANGVGFIQFKSKTIIEKAQYYKEDIQYKAESFPLVGHLNVKNMWIQTIMENLTDDSFFTQYDETGHKKYDPIHKQ